MEVEIVRGKKGRRAYGFDDIAIVPSRRTRDPDDVDITLTLGPYRFELPVLASAMDGVVSPESAGATGKLGGLAVLNLEGIWSRYENAAEQLERIAGAVHRRRLRLLLHRAPPDAHGRRRRSRRCRPRGGMHHAWRPRYRRAAGDRDRGRRGRAVAAHARDRRVLQRHRRRRHAHGRR